MLFHRRPGTTLLFIYGQLHIAVHPRRTRAKGDRLRVAVRASARTGRRRCRPPTACRRGQGPGTSQGPAPLDTTDRRSLSMLSSWSSRSADHRLADLVDVPAHQTMPSTSPISCCSTLIIFFPTYSFLIPDELHRQHQLAGSRMSALDHLPPFGAGTVGGMKFRRTIRNADQIRSTTDGLHRRRPGPSRRFQCVSLTRSCARCPPCTARPHAPSRCRHAQHVAAAVAHAGRSPRCVALHQAPPSTFPQPRPTSHRSTPDRRRT